MKFRELYENVNVKNINLKALYDKYNRELFDDSLPKDLPIRTGNLKTMGGMVKSVRRKIDGKLVIVPQELVISSFYNREDEKAIESILVHEMIHVFFDHNNIEDSTGAHGLYFKKKLKELQSKVDFTIPMTDILTKSVSDHIKSKMVDVVLLISPSKEVISVLKKGMLETPMLSIRNSSLVSTVLDDLVDRYDSKVIFDDYLIYFLQSNDRNLLQFTIASKPSSMKHYLTNKEFADTLIKNSRLILKLDKKELKNRIEKLSDSDYRRSWLEKYLKDVN